MGRILGRSARPVLHALLQQGFHVSLWRLSCARLPSKSLPRGDQALSWAVRQTTALAAAARRLFGLRREPGRDIVCSWTPEPCGMGLHTRMVVGIAKISFWSVACIENRLVALGSVWSVVLVLGGRGNRLHRHHPFTLSHTRSQPWPAARPRAPRASPPPPPRSPRAAWLHTPRRPWAWPATEPQRRRPAPDPPQSASPTSAWPWMPAPAPPPAPALALLRPSTQALRLAALLLQPQGRSAWGKSWLAGKGWLAAGRPPPPPPRRAPLCLAPRQRHPRAAPAAPPRPPPLVPQGRRPGLQAPPRPPPRSETA